MSSVVINPYALAGGANGIDITPTMTSDTAPSGTVSASSVNAGSQAAWKALDDPSGTSVWHSVSSGGVGWWEYEFDSAETIYTIKITSSTGSSGKTYAPKTFTIEGSNNGTDYTTLLTVTGESAWGESEQRTYDLTTPGSYTHYKIDITATESSTYIAMESVRFLT